MWEDVDVMAVEIEALVALEQDERAAALLARMQAIVARYVAEEPVETKRHEVEANLEMAEGLLALRQGKSDEALARFIHAQKLHPGIGAKARAEDAWRRLGGSPEGLLALATLPTTTEAAGGSGSPWEEREEQLPPFQLIDLAGKTWKSADLAGKTLFVSIWATWCGPCGEELPYVEKLTKALASRADVAVVTFNVDDNTGVVQPFLARNGIDVPVLFASAYMRERNGLSTAIPTSWIVDGHGVLRRAQLGFNPMTAGTWVAQSTAEIDAVRNAVEP
ncbi:MAG: TlpA disulfide reductase family protein [Acidobacteriota bacterium]